MRKRIRKFTSFRHAEEEERREHLAMHPHERLAMLHTINQRIYGKDVYAGRLQRILEVVGKARR